MTTRTRLIMKKGISFAAILTCSGLALSPGRLPHTAIVSAQTNSAVLYDWLTDGGDQRSTGIPSAYRVPSYVTTYTWLSPAEGPIPRTNDVIVVPLAQSSLPVAASSA